MLFFSFVETILSLKTELGHVTVFCAQNRNASGSSGIEIFPSSAEMDWIDFPYGFMRKNGYMTEYRSKDRRGF